MQLRPIGYVQFAPLTFHRSARRWQLPSAILLPYVPLRKSLFLDSHARSSAEGLRQRRLHVTAQTLQQKDARGQGPPQALPEAVRAELGKALQVFDTTQVPHESTIVDALRLCEQLAKSIVEESDQSDNVAKPSKPTNTATSNLLALEDQANKQAPAKPILKTPVQDVLRDEISACAERIVMDPKTFLSSQVLGTYVNVQSLLRRPQSFPQIFDLYATKPIPQAGSSPIRYKQQNPESAKVAIPLQIASNALDAALQKRDLALCLNIITTTVATSSFRRAKFFRKALVPSIALGLSPAAAYTLAASYANFQDRLDPERAMWSSMLCFMTYFIMVAISGFAAVTTDARNHDRITWRPGTPLNQRWYREQERLFTDRIAQAWGFKDYLKRGLEEGEDWENLRAWAMTRNMDLDKAELLEGME